MSHAVSITSATDFDLAFFYFRLRLFCTRLLFIVVGHLCQKVAFDGIFVVALVFWSLTAFIALDTSVVYGLLSCAGGNQMLGVSIADQVAFITGSSRPPHAV